MRQQVIGFAMPLGLVLELSNLAERGRVLGMRGDATLGLTGTRTTLATLTYRRTLAGVDLTVRANQGVRGLGPAVLQPTADRQRLRAGRRARTVRRTGNARSVLAASGRTRPRGAADAGNATGFFRALPLILLLCALSFVSAMVAKVNLGPDWTAWGGVGVPAALLLWAAWRPGSSRAKLRVMSGASFAMNSLKWLTVIACGLTLPANGFHLDVWLTRGWPWAALAALAAIAWACRFWWAG